ncbi:MAG: late control protein, partial [Bacteroidia bacterium]|nr:late control protein [Bacteroidia bacterium]
KSIKHRIGWNVVSADNLKLRKADDVKVQVQFEFKKSTGEAVTISAGTPGGVVKKQTISIVSDTKKLKEIAEAALKKETYDGYEGSYTGFLIPFVQNGYRASLYDKKYPERQGNYFVESVETTYGQSGGRRDVQIGVKLSDI